MSRIVVFAQAVAMFGSILSVPMTVHTTCELAVSLSTSNTLLVEVATGNTRVLSDLLIEPPFGRKLYRPLWFPDGIHLLVQPSSVNPNGLIKVNAYTASEAEIIAQDRLQLGDASISYNGEWVAYTTDFLSRSNPIDNEIVLVHLPTGNRTRLDPLDGTYGFVSWSPDGTQLMFSVTRSLQPQSVSLRDTFPLPVAQVGTQHEQVWLANANGTELRLLLHGQGRVHWSPDGTRWAFTRVRGGEPGLYLLEADGSTHLLLAGYVSFAAWSPQGTTSQQYYTARMNL